MNYDGIRRVKESKPFTAFDAVIAVLLAAAVGIAFAFLYRLPAHTVTVSAPGVYRELSLSDSEVIELGHLTVHVDGGYVWVTDSDCPEGTCEHTGAINRAGQSIVCLPNNIVITITGESDIQWEAGR